MNLIFLTSGLVGSQFFFRGKNFFILLFWLSCSAVSQPLAMTASIIILCVLESANLVATTVVYIEYLYFTDKKAFASATAETVIHGSQNLFADLYFLLLLLLREQTILITVLFYIFYMAVTLLNKTLTQFFSNHF